VRDLRASLCSLILLFATAAQGQLATKWVLLPFKRADKIIGKGTWHATDVNIADANDAISQVSGLVAESWSPAVRIDHPETYFRQYVPTLLHGRKILYVNAFCDERPYSYWRTQLVVVADGATCYWQAIFDPATKKYEHLTINARA
jgi:hypothetical protein